MANMLYNGVELPNIDSVWTDYKDGYPNGVLLVYQNQYRLFLLVNEPTATGSSVYYKGYYRFYVLTDGSWVLSQSGSASSRTKCDGSFVWSNVDIKTSGGTVVFAASDPVDPNAPDVPELSITQLGAFLLGQQLRRNLAAVREPVAYLYNGVRLPKLPESEYPYASIAYDKTGTGTYLLWFMEAQGYVTTGNAILKNDVFLPGSVSDAEGQCYKLSGSEWVAHDTGVYKILTLTDSNDSPNGNYVVWASHDVKTVGGTVYLAATDPIPIYE